MSLSALVLPHSQSCMDAVFFLIWKQLKNYLVKRLISQQVTSCQQIKPRTFFSTLLLLFLLIFNLQRFWSITKQYQSKILFQGGSRLKNKNTKKHIKQSLTLREPTRSETVGNQMRIWHICLDESKNKFETNHVSEGKHFVCFRKWLPCVSIFFPVRKTSNFTKNLRSENRG